MGHNRLGTLPDSRPWRRVVAHIAEGDGVAVVAAAASKAAVGGLERGASDRGVSHVVFLLARAALAARTPDLAGALGGVGVSVPTDPGLFDLTAALTAASRDRFETDRGSRTDLGEMAVLAGAEAVTHVVGERVVGLFPSGGELRDALRESSTKAGFAHLAHEFFSRFLRRFLLYHLSRELSRHVGGNGRFADAAAHNAFLADLATHCREAAAIVRVYSGEWYDKARFEKGVTERQARGFTEYCLDGKLAKELAIRGRHNG